MGTLRVMACYGGLLWALAACGGRTLEGRPAPAEAGGAAGSGAGAQGHSGSGNPSAGTAGKAAGGTGVGGTGQLGGPFVVGIDPNDEKPPFELPLWVTSTWEEYRTTPLYKVCDEGWSAEETLSRITAVDVSLMGVERHELFDVEPTFNNLRAQDASSGSPLGRRVFLFELTTGQTAVAYVFDDQGAAFQVRYVLVEKDCTIHMLGYYAERYGAEDCASRQGRSLWGIPPLPPAARCPDATGIYGFLGQVTQDFCGRSAPTFTGFFSYSQVQLSTAQLHFVEFALPELTTPIFALNVTGVRATAQLAEDNPSCGRPDVTNVVLQGSSLEVDDDQGMCFGDQQEPCHWVMSGKVYGPLP